MINRTFLTNTLYNVMYRVVNTVYPFVTSIYVSNILQADGVGQVSSAQNIVAYFTMAAALGIPNYGIREVAKNSNEERNNTFWELFSINFVSTTMCVFLYYTLVNNVYFFEKNIILYNVVGLSVISNYFNVDWFYYGCEKYKAITLKNMIVKVVCLTLMFVFVKAKQDGIVYALIVCLSTMGNNLLNILGLPKYGIKMPLGKLKIRHHISPILVLLATTVSIELYTLLDTTLLTFLTREENVGYFSNASKLIKIVITLLVAVSGALLPRLTSLYSSGQRKECEKLINKVTETLVVLMVPSSVGLYLLSPTLIPLLFGQSFEDAVITVRILIALMYSLTFSNLFGTQILLIVSQERKLLYATFAGAAVNIAINLLLIPIFQHNGSAIASVLSEFVVTGITYYFARKYFAIKVRRRTVVTVVAAVVIMSMAVELICTSIGNELVMILLSVVVSVIIYFFILIVLKCPLLMDFYSKIKK